MKMFLYNREYDNIELKSQLDEYQSEIDSLRTEV